MDRSNLASRFAKLSPAKRALLEQRLRGKGLDSLTMQTVPLQATRESAPLSFAQRRLWFLDQYEPNSSVYNVSGALRLRGSLDVGALERSLQEICRRHESLRTTFSMVGGEPAQVISLSLSIPFHVVDLTDHPESEREEKARWLAGEETRRPFDLGRGPVFRASLIRLGDDDHVLVLTLHHIVSDGWSMGVLYRELSALYQAFIKGEPSPLPDLLIQYADFAVWQREWLNGEVLENQLFYWKKQLEGAPGVLNLPTDRPRPAVQSFRGKRQSIELCKELTQGLKALSRKEGVTLFMTLLAAFQTLLYRYTGQEDIVVGSPIANRNRTEIEGLIGFFVNTLVLRTDLSGNPTFQELLRRVREMALEAYAHQDLPFEKLVEELKPERSLSHSPVFQLMLVLQNAPSAALKFEGLSVSPVRVDGETAKFDLTLSMHEAPEGLRGSLQYNIDLFDDSTLTRMLGHFQVLLQGIVTNPEKQLLDLLILTEAEKHQLIIEWNDTKRDYPKDKCIHQLFEKQVAKSPDAVAVIFEDRQLTYGELNQKANQLAHYLKKLGVGAEVLVGICVERSLEMVIGLLGILKAGGAYVPLDPEYPKERLTFMLQDTQAEVLITQQRLVEKLPDHSARLVCLDTDWEKIANESDENSDPKATAENLAYVIYTSGSTGRPKGVKVEHHSTVALLSWAQAQFTEEELAGVLASTSICFDLSIFELFAPLTSGGKIILAQDALALPTLSAASEVTLINTVPSAIATLVQLNQIPGSISTINLAGEPLKTSLVREIYRLTSVKRLYDLYGPSEDTTYSTCVLRTVEGPQTIGKPIPNTAIHLLNSHLSPVPIGVAGELYVGGDGLARGYLNRPELTAEKFIPHPFSEEPGARLYKTGDLARYLPDGNIEFLGRIDHQVKIRGFRIELGEIESVLAQHPEVRETVVMAREDDLGDKRLVAYVVARQEAVPTTNELRSFLKKKLPEYMIPSAYVVLETLPLTPSGKLDRKALLGPDQKRPGPKENYVPPRTPTEKTIAEIWGEVLNVGKVGIHDNFFELGGHSLLATQVISRLGEALQANLPLRALFEYPTVAEFAAQLSIQRQKKSSTHRNLINLQSGKGGTHVFCFPYLGGLRSEYINFSRLAPLVGRKYSFYGLQIGGLLGKTPRVASVEGLATDYIRAIQRCQPHGPYFLIGECAGGVVAFETARQLQKGGEKVDLLFLLDTSAWSSVGSLKRRLKARLHYRRMFGSTPWWWDYYGARTRFHVRTLRQLQNSKRLPYLFDKMGKAIASMPGAVRKSLLPEIRTQSGVARVAEDRISVSVKKAERAYHVSLMRYKFRPDYPGRITLLVNEKTHALKPSLGWNKIAVGGLDIHKIPGEHDSCGPQNIPLVAQILKQALDKAE